jgi:uncharacterized protein
VQVAVVGPSSDPRSRALVETALRAARPGLVVAWGHGPTTADQPALLDGRPVLEDGPTAYPCRGFVCHLPVTHPEELAAALTQ